MSQTEEINEYVRQKIVVDAVELPPRRRAENQAAPLDEVSASGGDASAPKFIAHPRKTSMAPNDSYGDWRIIVSQRAIKHCRELYTADPATVAIVEKKLE